MSARSALLVRASMVAVAAVLALTGASCEGRARATSSPSPSAPMPQVDAAASGGSVDAAAPSPSPSPSLPPLATRLPPDVLVQASDGLASDVVARLTGLVPAGHAAAIRLTTADVTGGSAP